MPLKVLESKPNRPLTIPEIKAELSLREISFAAVALEIGVNRVQLMACLHGFERATTVREKFAGWLGVEIDLLPPYTGPRKKSKQSLAA